MQSEARRRAFKKWYNSDKRKEYYQRPEVKEHNRLRQRERRKRADVKEKERLYNQRDYVKEASRKSALRYSRTEHGKIIRKRYLQSDNTKQNYKQYKKRYRSSELGKATENRYQQSDKHRQYVRYYESLPESIERKKERSFKRNVSIKIMVMELLGDRCKRCGLNDVTKLQIDHIKNNGCSERRRFHNSGNEFIYYLNHVEELDSNLQLLCANCHMEKHNCIRQSRRNSKIGQ